MRDDLPDTLYHYTDIHALQGIVEKSEFWATESFFLNDTTELTLGLNSIGLALALRQNAIFDELLRDREVENLTHDELKQALSELERRRAPFQDAERLLKDVQSLPLGFVVSLSENRDQLSQWRAYARAGYCLGFSTEALQSSMSGHREIRRVSYQPDDKQQLADTIIEKVTNLRESLRNDAQREDSDNPTGDGDAIRDFRAKTFIATEAAFFKDQTFIEELEVRIVETNVRADFHWPNNYGMTPRKKFQIPAGALRSVTVGPGPHEEQRMRSLISYFAGREANIIEMGSGKIPDILRSKIPFRDW